MSKFSGKSLLVATVLGGTLGAAAAFFLSSPKARRARRELSNKIHDINEALQEHLEQVTEKFKDEIENLSK